MRIISLNHREGFPPEGAVWVLGFFDGVHKGHRRLLECAVEAARRLAGDTPHPVAVWSFSSLPKATELLTTREETAELLGSCGAEWLVLEEFDRIAHWPGDEFFRDYLCAHFRPAALVCGFNFHFGAKGGWNAEDLAEMGRQNGVCVHIVPPCVDENGEMISSTRIRTLVREGKAETALELLDSPYRITAAVEHGKKLGRMLGFPTINQRMPQGKVVPAYGVYFCRAMFREEDGRRVDLPGICNIGFRPTVNSDTMDTTLETYILGYSGDLYGKDVQISLYKYCRGETKFPHVEALAAQIAADAEQAGAYFADREDVERA